MLDLVSLLPTVENPHLELFEDFDLDPEHEETFFGMDLANVRVVKGCGKRCLHCIVPDLNIERMPFPAVLRNAERVKRFNEKVRSLVVDVFQQIESETGYKIGDFDRFWPCFDSVPEEDRQKVISVYRAHPIQSVIPWRDDFIEYPQIFFVSRLANYYDGDVSEYRDTAFLHEDGTPADYGDVFKAFNHPLRPVEFTTAGWSRTDRVAQRAMEKIVLLLQRDPRHGRSNLVNISVSRFPYMAQRGYPQYLEAMKNVIRTLAPLNPNINLFDSPDDPENADFIAIVVEPLLMFIESLSTESHFTFKSAVVSKYAGRMADGNHEEDEDIAGFSMPCYHLFPDGTVAHQTLGKGNRPTPIGERLYSLAA
ncbi:hypothetical protein COY07_05785 [Candidatus Peregrinibacteria bacterium CG_4_10_14_0_2_um_filter_43_11]|nr:MAG: hypothetical protein COY07_05785 [Candidatus Peregrinibacteria bacterium CG_4_10_14_0_2_um_filter_43_11]